MAILITGAAGFIGAHAVAALRRAGRAVVATDIVPAADAVRLAALDDLHYAAGPLLEVMADVVAGVEEVWHFAGNADIPLGVRDTAVDIRESVVLTRHLMEAMREHGVASLVFPSTSGVYGSGTVPPMSESDGPLLPHSLHAAGKVATEALISAYCSTFGLRAVICRLGNVVGGAMGRGIVRDFLHKLTDRPEELKVLGDGRQRKSYVLVDDVIAALRHVSSVERVDSGRCAIYNVAAMGSVDIAGVAAAVAQALGLPHPPRLVTEDKLLSWPGDQPVVELSIDKILSTGWRPAYTPFEAVRTAAERMHRGDVEALS